MAQNKKLGDVKAERDVVMGNQYTYNITQVMQAQAFIPPANLAELRAAYLAYLRRAYRVLDFKGIRQLETFARELALGFENFSEAALALP